MKSRNHAKIRTAIAAVCFLLAGVLQLMAGPNGGDWVLIVLFLACAGWSALSLFGLTPRRRERHEDPAGSSAES